MEEQANQSPVQAIEAIAALQKAREAQTRGMKEAEGVFLEDYRKHQKDKYEKPSVTVDMLIFSVADQTPGRDKALKVLLVKRGGHPFKGDWALPGGFVNIDESVDDAARRELQEETALEDIYMEQLFTWGDLDRDPRMRVISVSYMALIDSAKVEVRAGDDASDCQWFTVTCPQLEEEMTTDGGVRTYNKKLLLRLKSDEEELLAVLNKETVFKNNTPVMSTLTIETSVGIAFDHAKIIGTGLERLTNKLDYTPIAFHLVPETFTLTSLQKIYEAILGRKLLTPNFRRKIMPMVIETQSFKEGAHRPAKLYNYNPSWRLKNNDSGGFL